MNTPPKSTRLASLDALRGFDMLFIAGGEQIVRALAVLTGFDWLEKQMEHVAWHGFAAYDLIFPLFLFLAGVSLPFSLQKRLTSGASRASMYRHLFQRMLLLVVFGLIYNNILQFDFANQRYASVLARIGIAWFLAALITLHASVRWQAVWFSALLLGYWALLMLVPVPGFGSGNLSMEGSLVGYIDRMLLPGVLYNKVHDPEGLLSLIPSIGTAQLGVFAGYWLQGRFRELSGFKKGLGLLIAGCFALCVALLWDMVFPINKNLWTSSFTLFAGGLSLLLLGLFYLLIDVKGWRRWAFPFMVIGMNSITIYMVQWRLINFAAIRDFFLGGALELFPPHLLPLLQGTGYTLFMWIFLYFLWKKKIFLKV